MQSPMEQFEIKRLFPIQIGSLDASYTNSALWMTVAVIIAFFVFVLGMQKKALVPGRLQSVAEMGYEFVAGMVRDNVGDQGKQYFPFVLTLFVFILLFPFYWMAITAFRPDGELYRPWNAANYQPFWTRNPTLDHIRYLFEETLFANWLFNTMLIALCSTAISLTCGVLAGYALARLNFPFAGSLGTGIFVT